MPLITVDAPMLDSVEKKRQLVSELTTVAQKIYNIDHIIVLIRENKLQNIGINGELVSDLVARAKEIEG
jgi:4-oxalocrotonate tautomerase